MRVPKKSNESVLNRAYGCFGFLGLITLPFGLAAVLSEFRLMNFDEAGGMGGRFAAWTMVLTAVLGFPLFLGMIAATVYGIKRAFEFRHATLIILSVISIVCGGGVMLLLPIAGNSGGPMVEYAFDFAAGTYIAGNVLIPAWWFIEGRRGYRSKEYAQQ